MNCRINCINSINNKTIKTIIVSGTYKECEEKVIKMNEKIDLNKSVWKLTEINI